MAGERKSWLELSREHSYKNWYIPGPVSSRIREDSGGDPGGSEESEDLPEKKKEWKLHPWKGRKKSAKPKEDELFYQD